MKNLFENWNNYLNEFWYSDIQFEGGGAEYALTVIPKKKIRIKLCEQGTMMFGGEGMSEGGETEKKYFGNISNIALEIEKAYNIFLNNVKQLYKRQTYQDITLDDVKIEIDFFKDEVEKQTNGKAKALGCGAFRCAFDIEDEYIIKFDITPQGTARDQNKSDASIGRIGKFSDIFPRSIVSGNDYRWTALEKVKPFSKNVESMIKFASFFPNSKVDFSNHKEFHYFCVVISFVYNAGKKEIAEKKLMDVKTLLKKKNLTFTNDPLEIIANGFTQHNPYDRVIRVIKEFDIRPEEIRVDNTGLASNGRFVIIDSSIDAQIVSGFQKVSSAKNIPSDTKKL
jgi:hypothetical protein